MELRTTIEGLAKARAAHAEISARCDSLRPPLQRLGQHHQRKATRIQRSGERGIQARHGSSGLAASITYDVPGATQLVVGSNKVYAASMQFGPPGGWYRPKTGKYLAIPIADNVAGKRGDPKYDSPREVQDGFFFRGKSGGLFFGRDLKTQTGKKRRRTKFKGKSLGDTMFGSLMASIELLFVLVREVIGTDYMYVTHDPEDQTRWDRFVSRWILRGKA